MPLFILERIILPIVVEVNVIEVDSVIIGHVLLAVLFVLIAETNEVPSET